MYNFKPFNNFKPSNFQSSVFKEAHYVNSKGNVMYRYQLYATGTLLI